MPSESRQQLMAVQTVLGDLSPSELGITMPHEHFLVNTAKANYREPKDEGSRGLANHPVDVEIRGWLEQHWQCNRDNLVLDDQLVAIAEVLRYRRAGGHSMIDVTPVGIGRNPLGLARLSKSTGVNIVMGCGYYVETTHPSEVANLSSEDIADQIVSEFQVGTDSSGIRPGVIGEIGCSWPLTMPEKRVLLGAAAAQRVLGAALYIHPGRNPKAPWELLDLLKDRDVALDRVVMCHVERTLPPEALLDFARTKCFIEFDLFGMETTGSYFKNLGITLPSDGERLAWIRRLVNAGHLDQVLISQDICFKHRLARYGGHGYDHIVANILPWMYLRGFTQEEIDTIVVANPRRVATLPSPKIAPAKASPTRSIQ